MSYRSIITKFIIPLFIGAFVLYWIYQPNKPKSQNPNLFPQLMTKVAEKINERFKNGDSEQNYLNGNFQCPNIPNQLNIPASYFKCNPEYLNCYLAGQAGNKKLLTIEHEGKIYHIQPQEFKKNEFLNVISRNVTQSEFTPHIGYEVKVTLQEQKKFVFHFLLQNSCEMFYLPKRIYYAGTIKNEADQWDNFTQDYFLDTKIVNKRQIDEWRKLRGLPFLYKVENWHEPALNIKYEDQTKFCEFYGKRLMESHLLDAAISSPLDIFKPQALPVRSIYPWGQKLKKESHKNFISWMGIEDLIFGELESLNNKFHPWLNLKASSLHFPLDHMFHQIGKRVHWDGEDFFQNNFQFSSSINYRPPLKDIPVDSEIGVSFRCYLERSQ